MIKCTWIDCENEATNPQNDRMGAMWANLCVDHEIILNSSTAADNPKAVLSNWIKAQGGAKAAAKRMTGEL